MQLMKTKTWPVMELVFFKWAMLCIGLVAGAYLAPFVKQYLWLILAIGIPSFIRTMYFYYVKNN